MHANGSVKKVDTFISFYLCSHQLTPHPFLGPNICDNSYEVPGKDKMKTKFLSKLDIPQINVYDHVVVHAQCWSLHLGKLPVNKASSIRYDISIKSQWMMQNQDYFSFQNTNLSPALNHCNIRWSIFCFENFQVSILSY